MIRTFTSVTPDTDNALVFGVVNQFTYTNHRGETAERRVIPLCIRFGDCQCDPNVKEQWVVEGFDLDKNDFRTFALSKITPRKP